MRRRVFKKKYEDMCKQEVLEALASLTKTVNEMNFNNPPDITNLIDEIEDIINPLRTNLVAVAVMLTSHIDNSKFEYVEDEEEI